MSQKNIFYKKKIFWITCGIPSIASVIYLFIWATPRFESEAIIRVYDASNQGGGGAGVDIAGGGQSSSGSYIFREFVESWDCFQQLKNKNMPVAWQRGDMLSRFGGVLTFFQKNEMRLWGYYKSHVTASIDESSGLVHLKVDGYSPTFVYEINNSIISLAQESLKKSGIKSYQYERKMLENKMGQDRSKLQIDLQRMAQFQKDYGIADYSSLYTSVLSTIDSFQQSRLSIDTKTSSTQFLAAKSQQLAVLKSQLEDIDENIQMQKDYITQKLAPLYDKFSSIKNTIDEDTSLILMDDKSLLEVDQLSLRHAYYIDCVELPTTPTDSTQPKSLKWSAIVFISSFLTYLIIK